VKSEGKFDEDVTQAAIAIERSRTEADLQVIAPSRAAATVNVVLAVVGYCLAWHFAGEALVAARQLADDRSVLTLADLVGCAFGSFMLVIWSFGGVVSARNEFRRAAGAERSVMRDQL
jgi:hypothetical protein